MIMEQYKIIIKNKVIIIKMEKDKIQCIYHDEMLKLGIDVPICESETTKKKRYCSNHNKCKNCKKFTQRRNVYYCPLCICEYEGCSKLKIEGKNNCGNHICKNCNEEKNVSDPYCDKCKCPFDKCTNVRLDKKACYIHSCNICKEPYEKNKQRCTSKQCSCLSCHRERKSNMPSCFIHACIICIPLYAKAEGHTISNFSGIVHALTKDSNLKIMYEKNREEGYSNNKCPNQKVYECMSIVNGYAKTDKCIGFYTDCNSKDGLCTECFLHNRCTECKKYIRSKNPDILQFGSFCELCVSSGKCKICIKPYCYNKGRPYPELCYMCKNEYLFCNTCKDVFSKNSLEFLEMSYVLYEYNQCALCISKNMSHMYYKKNIIAGVITWKIKYADCHLNFIKKIHSNFNPCEISYDRIFDLVLTVNGKCDDKKIFMNCLINFLEIKDCNKFDRRLSQIYDDKVNIYDILMRCSLLPYELFILIIKKI